MAGVAPGEPEPTRIFPVWEITRRIREALEGSFFDLWIEGEISNLRLPSSGHAYFTLKDDRAQIAAVAFQRDLRGFGAELKDGQRVQAFGRITVYEPRGQYQVVVRRIREAGLGALQEAFERLKKKLAAEGLFDPARKRRLPLLPQRIGIVTSPTGAAIRDILNVLRRRFPNLYILVAPVRVQGQGAAAEIAAAIGALGRRGGLDVLIVGRGGGSIEDLWAFNEEVVARAIAASPIPVISAVGHEIDFTISDFVADVRAATPTEAAERVVGQKEDFEARLGQFRDDLRRLLRTRYLELANRLTRAAGCYVFREPTYLVRAWAERVAALRGRLPAALQGRARDIGQRLDELAMRAGHAAGDRVRGRRHDVRRLAAQLAALSPKAVLRRGFSVTRDVEGRLVHDAGRLREGQRLVTEFARGSAASTVTEIRKENEP